jgi:hypothetical protein
MTDSTLVLDDRTTRYVLEIRPYFEDLRQVTAQLAGLLVLAASGASAPPDHPMLSAAGRTFAAATDGILRTQPSPRAGRHHRHVLEAMAAVSRALTGMRESRLPAADLDRVLPPLRLAYEGLRQAAESLPGFEVVGFDRGCCAIGRRSDSFETLRSPLPPSGQGRS